MKTLVLAALALGVSATPLLTAVVETSLPLTSASPGRGEAQLGVQAPALQGQDPDGKKLAWSDFAGRAVILYFHAPRTRNASAALDQLSDALAKNAALKEGTTVLLVVDALETGVAAREELSHSGSDVRICINEGRELFKAYGVVAFPTAFVVDGEGHVVEAIRGFSTFFSFSCVAGCRFALGLIDNQAYQDLKHGSGKTRDESAIRSSRKFLMARKLISSGNSRAALPILTAIADESAGNAAVLALVVHLQLLAGDAKEAALWTDRLEEAAPDDPNVRIMRARLAIAGNDLEAARAILAEAKGDSPELSYTHGQILEKEGKWQEAATLYKATLDRHLFMLD